MDLYTTPSFPSFLYFSTFSYYFQRRHLCQKVFVISNHVSNFIFYLIQYKRPNRLFFDPQYTNNTPSGSQYTYKTPNVWVQNFSD